VAKRVLVIDDDSSIRSFMRHSLQSQGIEVLVAADGTSGVEIARLELPDLIFLDWMMPNLDGLDTLKILRGEDATTDIPIIMLTAKQETIDFSQAFAEGANAYLTKPYAVDELLLILKRFGLTAVL
jgi:DNA-binding response OmpR family regulator